MSSRDKILAAVKANQPEKTALPDIDLFNINVPGSVEKFTEMLTKVGGSICYVSGYDEIARITRSKYGNEVRVITPVAELKELNHENLDELPSVHDLQNVEVTVLKAHFGVAENGAVWVTEHEMQYRVLPFVTQHLAVIINAKDIVPNMHQAYERISRMNYGFGAFIAGPSKTADIEQSLVIGAHGPRSMTVFVMNNV